MSSNIIQSISKYGKYRKQTGKMMFNIYIPYINEGIFNNLIKIFSFKKLKTNLSLHYMHEGLESVIIDDYYGDLNDTKFPDSLKTLCILRLNSDAKIINVNLNNNIECLYLGCDQPIINANLPSELKMLILCNGFNQPIINANLPCGLKKLYLGFYFNHSLKDANLPDTLELIGLNFCESNHKIFDFNLPKSLINIVYNIDTLYDVTSTPLLRTTIDKIKDFIIPVDLDSVKNTFPMLKNIFITTEHFYCVKNYILRDDIDSFKEDLSIYKREKSQLDCIDDDFYFRKYNKVMYNNHCHHDNSLDDQYFHRIYKSETGRYTKPAQRY